MADVERWAPIGGYEGIYEVSTWGRVRSLPRIRAVGMGFRLTKERILSPKPGKYPAVTLTRLNDNRTFNVHSMVLQTFVGPAPSGMEACHWDGNGWNCHLENLRWDNRVNNSADKIRHGRTNRGERSVTAKLTSENVRDIRSRWASGTSQSALAREFGVVQSNISKIVNGKRWAHECC